MWVEETARAALCVADWRPRGLIPLGDALVQRVDAARAVAADHVVLALAGDVTQRNRLHANEHAWAPVDLHPRGQLIDRDQRGQKAARTEDTKTRAREWVGVATGKNLRLHDVE